MNFLSLRTHETAQRDIRMYAVATEELFAGAMPITYAAWQKNNRIAP
jgi:thymidylate synthase ThyX